VDSLGTREKCRRGQHIMEINLLANEISGGGEKFSLKLKRWVSGATTISRDISK